MTAVNAERSLPIEPPSVSDERVREQVWSLLAGGHQGRLVLERRAVQRFPYPHLVLLTPVGPDGRTPRSESIVVVGKHLSERGLGFFHPKPVPYRKIIASLRSPQGAVAHFLMEITWCRFTEQGWYEGGGRFLRPVPDPRGNRPLAAAS